MRKEQKKTFPKPEKGEILIEARHVSKDFYGVHALVDANIDIRAGEVHALVGGNASGKTTLVKIMYGDFHQTSGDILVRGESAWFRSPGEARGMGIGTVMQNLSVFDSLNAVDNLFSGQEICYGRPFGSVLNKKAMKRVAEEEFDRLGIDIPALYEFIRSFSGGQRQCITFARALLGGSDILLLDEPTAALGVAETANVMKMIKRCRDENKAVLIISHSIEDVLDIADRITIIRHGTTVATMDRTRLTKSQIIGMITGEISLEELDS